MKAMLSIKPKYVDRILSGEKTYEYRRRVFRNDDVDTIAIYSTCPQSAVVAEASIDFILKSTPEDVWAQTSIGSGIDHESFMRYFHGVNIAYAIKLNDVIRLEVPTPLSEYAPSVKRPPQSFVYLD